MSKLDVKPGVGGKWLANEVGLTQGIHSDHNEWVAVELIGQEVHVPLKSLGCGVPYYALVAAGLVEGVTLSTGDTVRLLTSGEWDLLYIKELHERQGHTDTDLETDVKNDKGSTTWVVNDTGANLPPDIGVVRRAGALHLNWGTAPVTDSDRGWRVVLIPWQREYVNNWLSDTQHEEADYHCGKLSKTDLIGGVVVDTSNMSRSFHLINRLFGGVFKAKPMMVLYNPSVQASWTAAIVDNDGVMYGVLECCSEDKRGSLHQTEYHELINQLFERWINKTNAQLNAG